VSEEFLILDGKSDPGLECSKASRRLAPFRSGSGGRARTIGGVRAADSNYYSLPLGRMARTEAPHNQERRPRRTDGRDERRTVAETIGREGPREELGNLVVSRWGARRRWAHA
jgi:hypothetical protein